MPNLSQFKYFDRFLNSTEKKIIKIATLTLSITLLVWGGVFVTRHSTFTPKNGGEYSEGMVGQPKLINPIFSGTNDIDSDLSYLAYSGLFRYDKNLKLVPDLALDFTVSSDKKTYTIKLREGIKWSDGEAFSADDAIFTFTSIQNPDVGSPLFPAFQGAAIEKISNDKIKFTLKEPYSPFLNSLTVGIIPEHIWGELAPGAMRLAKNNLQPIGTGPWKFEKLAKDDLGIIQSYTFTKNNYFYEKIPYIDTLVVKFFNDYQTAVDALRGQNISTLSFVPKQYDNKLPKKSVNIFPLELPQYTALFFNQNKDGVLKDTSLRLALSESLDKAAIIATALQDDGEVINSPFLKNSLGYVADLKIISYNKENALTILDKNWKRLTPEDYFKLQYDQTIKNRQEEINAALKLATSSPAISADTIKKIQKDSSELVRQNMSNEQPFYRKDKDGNILAIEITTTDTSEYGKTAEIIAKMWRTIGVQTTVRQISARQLSRDILKPREYQVLLYGEIIGSDPDPFPFWHSSQTEYPGSNLAMFTNRAADKLLEDARVEVDNAKRADLYQKFQNILIKEIPAIFLYTPNYTFAVNKDIKGINIHNIISPSDRFSDMGNWYVKTKWSWK
ncbi:MAG: ABC transporter substrate-binding protein [bacterium]|nr:ABC transporter substrate-binding protein [bacterium]